MNEFSSKIKSPDLPKIRISLDLPVKDFQTTQELHPPKKLEVKQIRTFGSQSERVHSHVYQGIKNYHPKLLKLPFKEPPSALSLTNQFLTSPKENVEFPEFVMSLPE